jgi:hypothetical protein
MCGKTLNHTNLLVDSGFLIARFKKTFIRKICLDDIRSGCKVIKPQSPYVS